MICPSCVATSTVTSAGPPCWRPWGWQSSAGVGVVVVLRVSAGEALEVALLTIVYSLYTTDKAALYAFGRVRGYLGIEVVGSALVVAATIGIALIGGPWYLAPFIIGYGAFVIGARVLIRLEAHGEAKPPTRSDRRSMLGYALLAGIGIVASAGFLQATQLLAARFAAPRPSRLLCGRGHVGRPDVLLAAGNVARAVPVHVGGTRCRAGSDGPPRHADLATRAMLALLGPVFVLAEVFLGAEAMYIFGGSDYVAGAPVLRLILCRGLCIDRRRCFRQCAFKRFGCPAADDREVVGDWLRRRAGRRGGARWTARGVRGRNCLSGQPPSRHPDRSARFGGDMTWLGRVPSAAAS